jgi:Nuclease-related domain
VELAARIDECGCERDARDLTVWKAPVDRELVVFDHDVLRAGGYAENRYKRGLRLWRSRSRLILIFCFGPFLALGLAGVLVEGHVVAWMAGVVFGVGTGAWIAMRESPPAYVENWRTGAEGERKTARALRNLDCSHWLVTHDLQNGRRNYDHILVGAPGVILLETKYPRGAIEMRSGQAFLSRGLDPEADKPCPWLRSSALAGAASLHDELRRRTGHRLWVEAVVVLWCEFAEGVYEEEKCSFVHGTRLPEWLSGRRDVLDEQTVRELRTYIESLAA